ncbi:LysE family translocator [Thiosulfativibrio zosterae]|uniref:Amino acid transporter LysE n=1 Tax=Thiosulfativibrio zosterae TaxID=2675053 RepID=A0A6F8PMI2_9GAMM|nr:LysE family translocator [Thiosulfativibrio zosterae]BBP43254.1 amino acid transporter LysE [Thiosulfativibrio zosterae]
MDNYFLYLLITIITIASPGPGVLLTLTNALRYGFRGSLAGIFGIAAGIFVVAVLSATSIALVLSTSPIAFTVLKYLGAAYLMYLGFRLWQSQPQYRVTQTVVDKTHRLRFVEGVGITVLNPKPIFFFMAVFPQFIAVTDSALDPLWQFWFLVLTYCVLVVVIHSLYAVMAKLARASLASEHGSYWVSKTSAVFHILLGLGLALAT